MSITKKQNSNGAFRFAWDADKTQRYRRHILLDEIGIEGQERIAASNVLIVGAGGLGSPVITYLAAAGVGHICVVDGDIVVRLFFPLPTSDGKKQLLPANV